MGVSEKSSLSLIQKNLKPNQKILAVSKLQNIEKISDLYNQGQKSFGENYIQEALAKIEVLKNLQIDWHLIGPIQKNKIKLLKNNFAYLHAIDSYELAVKISENAIKNNFVQKIFLQINISAEPTKSGFSVDELDENWPHLQKLAGIKIVGLMTMPPLENQPENNRPYFKKLSDLAKKINLKELSMGTSHDYAIALEEGSTWIRLGTILFGEREQK